MNLFGVGPLELVVILIVALVFVGPERLPRLAADIARTIRELRNYTGAIAAEFGEVMQDIEKETAGDRGQWKDITESLTGVTKSMTDTLRGARQDAEGTSSTSTAASPVNGAAANGAWQDIPDPEVAAPAAEHASTNGVSKQPVPADDENPV